MRIIIYTGKGGVGKTSIAAATACRLADNGKKVLIISTDQAHSLGDSFGEKLSGEPVRIFKNIDALEIDTVYESKKAWKNVHDYLKQIITEKANGGIEADEALLFPGFDELFSLLRILDAYQDNKHDVIIVDCAPTGETLSLLRYAEKLTVFADKVIPMIRTVNTAIGSLISKKTSVPKPKDIVFEEFAALIKRLAQLQNILHDRTVTGIRIVITPERIVLEEARRAYTWFQLYDFGVDAIFINKIYPEQALDGYFENWKTLQEEHIRIARESFINQNFFTLELWDEEIRSKKLLDKAAEALYGETDPMELFCSEPSFHIEEAHGTLILVMNLPFINQQDISILKEDADIIVSIKNETRRFHLPDNMARRTLSNHIYENGQLKIMLDY